MKDSSIQSNSIGKEFTFWSLLRFAFPSTLMMMVNSLYVIVDGIFVARFVGSDALAAVNIVAPAFALFMAIGIMLASGGSAIIARNLGEKDNVKANKNFTFITLCGIIIALFVCLIGFIFTEPILKALGANEILMPYCRDYMIIILCFAPTFVVQLIFQTIFITNGTPGIGMVLTILAGVVNMVFDYIFIVPCNMGIAGAALATGLGTLIPSIYGLFYFFSSRGNLKFIKTDLNWRVLGYSCLNGSSEMISNLAYGLITFLYNISMMRLIGEDGVAAITIIQYAEFLMSSLFFGFVMGVAPVFSFNYGSQNRAQTKRIFRICLITITVTSLSIFGIAEIFGKYVVGIFAPQGTYVYNLAANGFAIFSFGFILMGANIFASALFTALSNGKLSAIISFLRACVFISGSIIILPFILDVNGIWLAVPIGEALTFGVSLFLILKKRKVYGYL
ncbi:MAG: MATE family efflux transporter [Clostridiales bacterium]